MSKLLIVTSSVREGRIADNILKLAQAELANYTDFEVTVADLKELAMPFFNSPVSPSQESFKPTDANVIEWTRLVGESDAVLFLVAEYNYSFTAVLKNAVDWIFKEWNDKPVALIGYGWVGGARAIAQFRGVMGSTIGAKAIESEANLRFMKEIDLEGNATDQPAVSTSIKTTLEELKTVL